MTQPAPRRGLDDPIAAPIISPRRALLGEASPPRRMLDDRVSPDRSRGASGWTFVALLGAGLAVLVAGLYGFYGFRGNPSPSPATPSSASSAARGLTVPGPTPSVSPVEYRTESLGSAEVSVPQHWETYHAEDSEDGHRLVRLRHPATDLRLQLATVADVGDDLAAACEILVEDQSKEWAVDHFVLPRTLSSVDGTPAVTCGFAGTEPEANTATTAQFTLVDGDDETLVLRDLRPSGLGADTTVLAEAAAMHCEAAATFGHPLPLCAPTPADRAGD